MRMNQGDRSLFLPIGFQKVINYVERAWDDSDIDMFKQVMRNSVWHTSTRLPNGVECLLVDVGAHDNLMGSEFLRRVRKLLKQHGMDVTHHKLEHPLSVEGVGAHSQKCTEAASIPVVTANGEGGTFTAPIVPHSEIPALLGLKGLKKNRALIDCVNDRIYFLGEGEVLVRLPPGSQSHQLIMSPSGHLMLPISHYDLLKRVGKGEDTKRSFTVTSESGPYQATPRDISDEWQAKADERGEEKTAIEADCASQ
jgi:hypothetical protein